MQLKSFSVSEYRSVLSSNSIETGDITCLVGKNESGKTALLHALYKLNPIILAHMPCRRHCGRPRHVH